MYSTISNHLAQALDKLIQRYKGKPKFAALLGTYIKQVQELEDATNAVMGAYDVDTADATRLEILGRRVGQVAKGAALEQFRAYIKARILANRSDGSPESLKGVARAALGQGTRLIEGAAWQWLTPRSATSVDSDVVTELLRDSHAAGTTFFYEFYTPPVASEQQFKWNTTAAGIVADNRGFRTLLGTSTDAVFSKVRQ